MVFKIPINFRPEKQHILKARSYAKAGKNIYEKKRISGS